LTTSDSKPRHGIMALCALISYPNNRMVCQVKAAISTVHC